MTIEMPETLRAGENLDTLLSELKEQLKEHGDLLLDFHNTSKIDSTGLGVLIRALSFARMNNADLRLTNLKESVASLFLITKLEQVFDIV